MLCYVCLLNFDNNEDFKDHILTMHKPPTVECSDSDESDQNEKSSDMDENKANEMAKNALLNSDTSDNSDGAPSPKSSRNTEKDVKNKRYTFRKRMPSARLSAEYQESSEHSDISLDPLEETEEKEDQSSSGTQPKKQVFTFKPRAGVNNVVMGNQVIQQPVYVANNLPSSKKVKVFDFNSENILTWLTKQKDLCRNLKYPLSPSLFNLVHTIHKAIFDRYCSASPSEETSAVVKVYEELNNMIQKHSKSSEK